MDRNLDFIAKVAGLKVSVTILSEVPAGSIPVWDFGVLGEDPTEVGQYTYSDSGRYTIKLYLRTGSQELELVGTKHVMVSGEAKTQLTDTIYVLIDKYIPQDDNLTMSIVDKEAYITKWQLYIQPLVNHDIPMAEYANESYYEGLENQLIMELAAYDYLCIKIENLLINAAKSMGGTGTGESTPGEERDRIKQITTGPTDVSYYDTVTEATSSYFKSYADATKPGGMLDTLRQNLCTLAQRMEIFLPFCNQPIRVRVPKVVNRRRPGPLDGPNPRSLVK